MIVRAADPDRDGAACAAIYAYYVATSPATFDELAPTPEQMGARIAAAHAWLVAVVDGAVAGYAYGSAHRERPAYRWAADTTVYVDAAHQRAGVGRALYAPLMPMLRDAGVWTACAGITLPNPGSEGLHAAMGFVPVGTYRRIGFKAGAWHDVRWWQLDLRPGDRSVPDGA
jgi:L-amino acid N-acyltransferase YncA